jgi:hypothetical protein
LKKRVKKYGEMFIKRGEEMKIAEKDYDFLVSECSKLKNSFNKQEKYVL